MDEQTPVHVEEVRGQIRQMARAVMNVVLNATMCSRPEVLLEKLPGLDHNLDLLEALCVKAAESAGERRFSARVQPPPHLTRRARAEWVKNNIKEKGLAVLSRPNRV